MLRHVYPQWCSAFPRSSIAALVEIFSAWVWTATGPVHLGVHGDPRSMRTGPNSLQHRNSVCGVVGEVRQEETRRARPFRRQKTATTMSSRGGTTMMPSECVSSNFCSRPSKLPLKAKANTAAAAVPSWMFFVLDYLPLPDFESCWSSLLPPRTYSAVD